MPKSTLQTPLSCLFAVNKPTGIVSMNLLNRLQPLFQSSTLFSTSPISAAENLEYKQEQKSNSGNKNGKRGGGGRRPKRKDTRIKMGQGGTLDPLADGVLVIGTNNATKQLAKFLDCTKEYRAIGIFGCSTDSYDSEGKRVNMTAFDHITQEKVDAVLSQFRGEIEQTPPIFSALKMDGKPLYEYARSGIPLPRPIPSRQCTVSALSLLAFTEGSAHSYQYPKLALGETEKAAIESLNKMIREGRTDVPVGVVEKERKKEDAVEEDPTTQEFDDTTSLSPRPPTFEISMTVSSGTYVRSIIHDIGIALGSSAHVVKLTRTRQGEFMLNDVAEAYASSLAAVGDPTQASVLVASTSTLATTDAPIVETAVEGEVAPSEAMVTTSTSTVIEEAFVGGCVEWEVLDAALKAYETDTEARIAGELLPFEVELLRRCKMV